MEVTSNTEVANETIGSMGIFKYDKSLLTRQRECSDVLENSKVPVPSAKIRAEWSYYVEVKIEPAGWQAFWRIPRVICESLKIGYPTVVFGMVEQVHFSELKATFAVTGVQDDGVHLPGRHEVSLVDLLPTKFQENSAVNVEATAECVDTLRYFYKHIWMPWDNDDDEQDWCQKHLKSRIEFNYDLQKNINRSLCAHIRTLLQEARDIQERRDFLETDLSEDEDLDETNHKSEITDLMRLHLRMASIKSTIDILENPEMREIYDEMRRTRTEGEKGGAGASNEEDNTFVVTKVMSIDEHLKQLDTVRSLLADAEQAVQLRPSMQHCLDACLPNTHIYLPTGTHAIKFVEPIIGNGTLSALPSKSTAVINLDESDAEKNGQEFKSLTIVSSVEDDSRLLTFDGNTVVDGITFDCRKVRTGIQIRSGSVLFINCTFLGDTNSSTKTGLVVNANARLWLTKCEIKEFATGIECFRGAQLSLQESKMVSCGTAIEFRSGIFQLTLRESLISHCKRYGISITRDQIPAEAETTPGEEISQQKFASVEELAGKFGISGKCEFADNKLANIVVVDDSNQIRWMVDSDVDDQQFTVPAQPFDITDSEDLVLVSDSDSELSMSVISSD